MSTTTPRRMLRPGRTPLTVTARVLMTSSSPPWRSSLRAATVPPRCVPAILACVGAGGSSMDVDCQLAELTGKSLSVGFQTLQSTAGPWLTQKSNAYSSQGWITIWYLAFYSAMLLMRNFWFALTGKGKRGGLCISQLQTCHSAREGSVVILMHESVPELPRGKSSECRHNSCMSQLWSCRTVAPDSCQKRRASAFRSTPLASRSTKAFATRSASFMRFRSDCNLRLYATLQPAFERNWPRPPACPVSPGCSLTTP
jgi:hypothetical protein